MCEASWAQHSWGTACGCQLLQPVDRDSGLLQPGPRQPAELLWRLGGRSGPCRHHSSRVPSAGSGDGRSRPSSLLAPGASSARPPHPGSWRAPVPFATVSDTGHWRAQPHRQNLKSCRRQRKPLVSHVPDTSATDSPRGGTVTASSTHTGGKGREGPAAAAGSAHLQAGLLLWGESTDHQAAWTRGPATFNPTLHRALLQRQAQECCQAPAGAGGLPRCQHLSWPQGQCHPLQKLDCPTQEGGCWHLVGGCQECHQTPSA